MQPLRHAIDWFEIPVRDMDRAAAFYEALLATTLRRETIAGNSLGVIKYHAEAAAASSRARTCPHHRPPAR